ncbi:hypothetical protein F5877DRAFT_71931 [Lentinula edodes]|nr:hypothetical protein F5877DRAFT_71931 [Lentinula edodes]
MSIPHTRSRTRKETSYVIPPERLASSSPESSHLYRGAGKADPDPSFSTLPGGAIVGNDDIGHLNTADSGFLREDNATPTQPSSGNDPNIQAYLSDTEITRGGSEKVPPVPVTPERKAVTDSTPAKSTPHSNHSSSFSSTALLNDRQYKVDEANKYLIGDLANVRTLPVKEWSLLSLNLDLDKDTYQLSEQVKKKFQNYLNAETKAKRETDPELYNSLIALLNELKGNSRNIVFYRQDVVPVRGSPVKQKPDIGAVFKELIGSRDPLVLAQASDEKIFWGLIILLIEVKHEKGKLIRDDFGIDAKWKKGKNSGKKRVKGADEASGRAPKANSRSKSAGDISNVPPKLKSMPVSTKEYRKKQRDTQNVPLPPDRNTPEGVRTQTGGYACDILSTGVLRSHVHIFIVDSTLVRGIFYDHSIIVESAVLNLENEGDQLIFAKMIKQLHALPPGGLGLIPELEAPFMKDPASLKYGQTLPEFEKAEGPPSNGIFQIEEIEEGSKFTFPYKNGTTRTVQLKRVLFRSRGIIGRGTIVVQVVCACTHCAPNQCDWSGKKLVLKLSFPSMTRVPEQAFMDRCKEKAKGEHAWVLNHLPHIYWTFDLPFEERSPQANFKEKFKDKYEMRLLRGSIQEELQPLSSLETALECAQVFYDIVQCHHWVYTYPQILHRDISDGNIMIRVKDGKKYGVLNDWDLAIWLNNRDGISTSQFRTGTRPYMAHEQHSPSWRGPHRYRHDLESLFYVILLLATLFSSPSERAYKSLDVDEDHDDDEDDDDEDDDNGKDDKPSETSYHYQTWFTQGDDFIYKDKALIILDLSWQPIPTQFFRDFFHWLMRLQHSLNAGFVALKGHIVRQRDTPRQIPHFDNDTLNSHFSYDCLVSIMHQFSEEKLETHGREWQEKLREFQKN